jgi:hypothetical protein
LIQNYRWLNNRQWIADGGINACDFTDMLDQAAWWFNSSQPFIL